METTHMTQAKKLKQEIRARARKTGESYTAARRQVLLARQKSQTPPAPPSKPVAGEASVVKKTGHGYDHWFAVLDAFGAPAKGHTAAAAHLHDDHGVPGWHSQMITVTYERARGLRVTNQSCAGDFQVSVSKAVPAPVGRVVESLTNSKPAEWLKDSALARMLGSATASVKGDASARLRFRWDASVVEIRITAKKGGATVVADNTKLSDAAQVEKRRQLWREALEALKEQLSQ
jgi:hypothetical protein